MMYKISEIAELTGLSRSTLLYYERINLVSPDKNGSNDYRIYSEKDVEELRKICVYRDMGLSLKEINKIIHDKRSNIQNILEKQLKNINLQINALRRQQKKILDIIRLKDPSINVRYVNKKIWINILEKSGMDEEGMTEWHKAFEKNAPEAHQDFLESLGIPEKEIAEIRRTSVQ